MKKLFNGISYIILAIIIVLAYYLSKLSNESQDILFFVVIAIGFITMFVLQKIGRIIDKKIDKKRKLKSLNNKFPN